MSKKSAHKTLSIKDRKTITNKLIKDLSEFWGAGNKNFSNIKEYITVLEEHVYDRKYLTGSLEDYRNKIFSLKFNLENNGNFLFPKYSPSELLKLTTEELGIGYENKNKNYDPIVEIKKSIASDLVENESKNKKKNAYEILGTLDDLQKNILPKVLGDGPIKSIIRCSKCGPDAYVKTHSRQTRSADEGETTFAECTICGKTWKSS
jgi:DNA-directed RNA polymerase subunit M/transcription elongation factor TFIIS